MMEVIKFNDLISSNVSIDTICLGSFDGFHLGHQQLIHQALSISTGDTAVVLFSNHPSKFVSKPVSELMDLDDKIRMCNKLRIEYVIVIETDEEFFSLIPEEFIDKYLKLINPKHVVVGEDFRFGKYGKGNSETLKNFFDVLTVDLLEKDGLKISSTSIREYLKEGRIEEANELLGYHFEIKGKVEEGLHNGTTLGFPTANISFKNNLQLINNGVFAAISYVNGIPYKSMVNIGIHPSIDKLDTPIIESHLIDYSGNLYGKTIYIEFIKRIRDEKKFANIDELKNQLSLDIVEVKKLLTC